VKHGFVPALCSINNSCLYFHLTCTLIHFGSSHKALTMVTQSQNALFMLIASSSCTCAPTSPSSILTSPFQLMPFAISDWTQKSIMGYIQGSPFRIETEFMDAQGKPYKNTATVKGKKDVLEDVPVYSNRDTVKGQVLVQGSREGCIGVQIGSV